LKVGGEYRREFANNATPATLFRPTASSLLISPMTRRFHGAIGGPATGAPATVYVGLRNRAYALFVNDWKVTRNFSITLGLRDEYFAVHGQQQPARILSGSWGQLHTAPGHRARRLREAVLQYTEANLGPRFGFAWDPKGSGKMSIRGGTACYDHTYSLKIGGYGSNLRSSDPPPSGRNLVPRSRTRSATSRGSATRWMPR
jgi:hypothetical protein